MTNQSTGCQARPRVAMAVLTCLSLLFFAAGHAAAQECYPPGSASCTSTTSTSTTSTSTTPDSTVVVSDETVSPGQSFTFRVGGFRPGTIVTFMLDGQLLGTAIADAQGMATLTVTLPAGTAPGQHTITATGTGADGQPRTVSQVITVNDLAAAGGAARSPATSTGPGRGGSLARTGTTVVPTAAVGIGLLVAGVVLRRTVKKKKALAT